MRILVATDGDLNAQQPANALARWIEAPGTELHLLSVVNPGEVHAEGVHGSTDMVPAATWSGTTVPGIQPQYPHGPEDRGQALDRARAERHDLLKEAGSRWFPGAAVEVHIVEDKETANAILRVAQQVAADLIAMSAHHHSAAAQRLRQNLHEEVVQHSPVPVFVVGPEVVGR